MEVELWVVVVEEWCVMAIFFFVQYVNFVFEVFVRFNRIWFIDYYIMFDVVFVDIMQQQISVVISFIMSQDFMEYFYICDSGSQWFCVISYYIDDFNGIISVDNIMFDMACSNSIMICDREYVFDRYQEVFIDCMFWFRNI